MARLSYPFASILRAVAAGAAAQDQGGGARRPGARAAEVSQRGPAGRVRRAPGGEAGAPRAAAAGV